MVLALQIILAACFVGIAVDLLVDVNKNHKGECKKASGKLWAQAMRKLDREIPENLLHLDSNQPARQEAASVVARTQQAVAS